MVGDNFAKHLFQLNCAFIRKVDDISEDPQKQLL